jgi:Peptidase propeptide and YPEB domain
MNTPRTILAAVAIVVPGLALPGLVLPGLAMAGMPAVGDMPGTTPEAVRAALDAAGCPVDALEAEKGKIEAKCHDATGKTWDVYIDPATGKVAEVSDED